MRRRISKTPQKAKRRCRARRNSCLQGEAGEAKYHPRSPSSKQVWKDPKLVSVTLSSPLLCLYINNHSLFTAVHIARPTRVSPGSPRRTGQSWLQQRGMKSPSSDPRITPPHPLAASGVYDGRVSAQLFPHFAYPEVTQCLGTRGSCAAHGLEQAALDYSQGKAALRCGKTSCCPRTPSLGKMSTARQK